MVFEHVVRIGGREPAARRSSVVTPAGATRKGQPVWGASRIQCAYLLESAPPSRGHQAVDARQVFDERVEIAVNQHVRFLNICLPSARLNRLSIAAFLKPSLARVRARDQLTLGLT